MNDPVRTAGRRRFTSLTCLICLASVALATGCLAPQQGPDARLSERLDLVLNRLSEEGATVAVRVLELPRRRELYARNIDEPYVPASNFKLLISAAALDLFGPDRTFKTYLALDGDDLWIVGTGDPGPGDPRLATKDGGMPVTLLDNWAQALERRGVRRIAGDLYYYDGAFDEQHVHPSWGNSVLHWYGAPVTGLTFNDNCVDITVYPTEEGQPARYEVMPPVRNITVINRCLTGAAGAPTIVKRRQGDVYELGGGCSERTELKSKPVGHPGAFFADALRTHLASRGIEVAGEIRRAPEPLGGIMPPPSDRVVAVHQTTLPDVLSRVNKNSQNLFAECLCKLIGQEFAAREGRRVPGSWADGERAIRAFLRRSGIDDRALALADGSGLSDENRTTARMLTDLLATMFDRSDREVFRASLSEAAVDGSLRDRLQDEPGRVFGKTGYIGGVSSLSGYVKTRRDKWLAFSIIYNHIPDPDNVEPYTELQDEACRVLIEWPNPGRLPSSATEQGAQRQ